MPAGLALPDSLRDSMRTDGTSLELETMDPTRTLYELTSWAVKNEIALDGLQVTRPSLEDVYLQITKEADAKGSTA